MSPLANIAIVVLVAIAAATDVRTGRIPNWLTLPLLIAAPIFYFVVGGSVLAGYSILSAAVCAAIPYLLFRMGAGGGGDVKLFAAIGALVGFGMGVEIQFVAFLSAAVFSLGRLAWHGKLMQTLFRSALVPLRPLLPADKRSKLAGELMTEVRLGGFTLLATGAVLFARYSHVWIG